MRFSNFRDLHDVYPKIKEGKLFRSEAPTDFQKEDWDELYDLGVRTIIDFRSDSEREEDNYVCDPRFTRHNWCCLMPETGINDFYFPRLVTKQSSAEEIIGLSSFIVNGYKVIPFSNTAYQNVFSLMETTDDGILFHCGGGKDRTGIFAALVLSLFGCDKQTIFDDYLKSNESVKNHLMPKLLQSDYPQPVKDTLMYVCSVHTELLESSFEAILQKYDSLEEYFDSEYKMNRDLLFSKYISKIDKP